MLAGIGWAVFRSKEVRTRSHTFSYLSDVVGGAWPGRMGGRAGWAKEQEAHPRVTHPPSPHSSPPPSHPSSLAWLHSVSAVVAGVQGRECSAWTLSGELEAGRTWEQRFRGARGLRGGPGGPGVGSGVDEETRGGRASECWLGPAGRHPPSPRGPIPHHSSHRPTLGTTR